MKMQYQGQEVIADVMEVIQDNEKWSEYQLKDGTVVRIKTVVLKIMKLRGIKDEQGNQSYAVNSKLIVSAIEPGEE